MAALFLRLGLGLQKVVRVLAVANVHGASLEPQPPVDQPLALVDLVDQLIQHGDALRLEQEVLHYRGLSPYQRQPFHWLVTTDPLPWFK
jgi:hypothetical protein